MEARISKGFNAHYSYGFIKEPCSCHPVEGTLVHPFNELLYLSVIKAGISCSSGGNFRRIG